MRELETLNLFYFFYFIYFFFCTRYLLVTLLALHFLGSLSSWIQTRLDPEHFSKRLCELHIIVPQCSVTLPDAAEQHVNQLWVVGFCDTGKVVSLLHSQALFKICLKLLSQLYVLYATALGQIVSFSGKCFCISSAP